MAVRFVIGRAGTGKTYHCLQAIRDAVRADPIDGRRLILLVPEQASLQMERAILQPSDIPGAHRAEVLSFQRLAFKVLDSVPGPVRTALSEPARAMVLRHLLARQAHQLRYYRRVERLTGFVERLTATISELIQEAVPPEELTPIADAADSADHSQSAKLHDLRLIYAAYVDYLGSDRLDPSQYLQAARERLARCPWLGGADVWVDGFASLSGQEMLTLIAVARVCHHIDITLLMDPVPGELAPGAGKDVPPTGLFSKTYRSYQELHRALRDASVTVKDPLLLRVPGASRFGPSPALAHLERSLFDPAEAGPDEGGPAAPGLEVVELPSRRVEVDYAVSRLCQWVRESGLRYRDAAIIVRDLDVYHDLLREALTARGVPCFIDRRRSIAHHPLVELLRAGIAMAAEALSLESVRLALKTGLIPMTLESADELENYLLAHGISGFDAWEGEDWAFTAGSAFDAEDRELDKGQVARLARINHTRRSFGRRTRSWLAFASAPGGHTGPDWIAAITDWLGLLRTDDTIRHWIDEAETDGDIDQAAEHEQVLREVSAFLDDLAYAFAEVTLTVEELARILDSGLSSLTLGLAPPMIDQVLVGSIERSRHPEIRAAVILGFNDGVFPAKPTEDSILNDDDRDLLREHGVHVAPPARERILEEALLVYIALTRASECCVITYATADNDGKTLRPSPYVEVLRQACPSLKVSTIGEPTMSRDMWDILSSSDLTKRLAMEFRSRVAVKRDNRVLRGRWNELYDKLRPSLAQDTSSMRVMRSLGEQREAHLSPTAVERAFTGPLRTSVSQLETYATCPFQYFARYVLRLQEREEVTLTPVDVGQFHHAILEDFVNTLCDRGQGFAQLSEAELMARLDESCDRLATRWPADITQSNARNAYLVRRSAAQLARIIRAQRKVSQSGTATPRATEVAFGFDRPGSLPAMELPTPAGRRAYLRGFIDRVDLAEVGDELLGVVIDYKRRRDQRLNLAEVYHGLSLQLLGYLLVLGESGETLAGRPVRPIAGLYVSVTPKYHLVDHPAAKESRDAELGGTYRPRGLLRHDDFGVLDQSTESGWSEHYSVFRKKDGDLGQVDSSDAADAGSFDALLEHTRTKLGQLADGILDGDVAIRPYRLGTLSPCSWCAMESVCRFEMGISDVRFLETLKRSEVFRRLVGSAPN